MMFQSATLSLRTKSIKLTVSMMLAIALSSSLLVYMFVSVHSLEEASVADAAKVAAYEKMIEETERDATLNLEEASVLAEIVGVGKPGTRLYSPLHYLVILEKEKPDNVRFEELSFDVNKGVFTAIVLSREYEAITAYLEKLEAKGQFRYAHLIKKGQVDREGVRYQVEFGVMEAGEA